MWLLDIALEYVAPLFLVLSPITSYADQIWSIHKNKSSAGFSLDIPLIMLVASILKVFYWFGAYYSYSLLLQAIVMIAVQVVLLKVALDHRPSPGVKDGIEHVPFSAHAAESSGAWRPYNFWQWRSTSPYWTSMAYFVFTLLLIHILLPPISQSPTYISFLGYAGLGIEAFLPVPQILANQRVQSCKGFRLSVLGAWLIGDGMKMCYFFLSKEFIPWAFRISGILQCSCDCYLGVQYYMFEVLGMGSPQGRERGISNVDGADDREKDIRLS